MENSNRIRCKFNCRKSIVYNRIYRFQFTNPEVPAINAGTDVGLTKDINGNPIVGDPDIGAYEFQKKIIDEYENISLKIFPSVKAVPIRGGQQQASTSGH